MLWDISSYLPAGIHPHISVRQLPTSVNSRKDLILHLVLYNLGKDIDVFGGQLPMIRDHSLDGLGQENPKSRSPLRQNNFPRRHKEEFLRFGSSGGCRYR